MEKFNYPNDPLGHEFEGCPIMLDIEIVVVLDKSI
jgi:hypothetical protein